MTMEAVYQNLATYVAAHTHQFGDHESILGVVYNCYKENNAIETSEMKAGFDVLYSLLNEKMSNETEGVIDTVCALCSEYEKVGFTEGIQIGIRLAQEIRLP